MNMIMRVFCINIFLMLVVFQSCQNNKNTEIVNIVKEWTNKEVKFDNGYIFTQIGKDSIFKTISTDEYKILVYTDSIGCMRCNLKLAQWMDFVKQLDSISNKKVSFLFFIHPKDVTDLLLLLQKQKFDLPVCIDKDDSLNKLNHFPTNSKFQTFLLNERNKVMAIGNPMHSPKIKELYLNILSDKQYTSSPNDKILTKIVTNGNSIDWGSFNWKEHKTGEFILTNIGPELLVIDDIVTSCGCITVDYTKEPVQIGHDLMLKVKYIADHPEYFNKTITIYCNTKNSPIQLKITGNSSHSEL